MTNSLLLDLGVRINEAHRLAIAHAGNAIEQAITCGQLLLEAKRQGAARQITSPSGSAPPKATCSIAQRLPDPQRVADLPLRHVLAELRTPMHATREAINA
jgi:hypothetical protein